MTRRIKSPGADSIREARKAFREEYPHAEEWQVKRLALLSVSRDAFEAQVAAGQNIDLAALLRVDEVIETTRATLKLTEPMSINVHLVKSHVGIANITCRHCGKHDRYEISRTPFDAPAEKPAETGTPAPPVAPATADAPVSPDTPAKPSDNVVPMKVGYRDGVSASAFHSQTINGREVPPLKREQSRPYRTADQAQRDPHPYRDAAGGERGGHPLPVLHGVIW